MPGLLSRREQLCELLEASRKEAVHDGFHVKPVLSHGVCMLKKLLLAAVCTACLGAFHVYATPIRTVLFPKHLDAEHKSVPSRQSLSSM